MKNKLFPLILVFAVTAFLFRNMLFGTAVFGDAPHFYLEEAVELFGWPFAWIYRGTILGGTPDALWLSPMMVFWGFLAHIGFGNGFIIRLLFYFPAIIVAFGTSYFVAGHCGLERKGKIVTSLFYVFNTYFLLLLDGGVLGVALAYGVFPLSTYFVQRMVSVPSKHFFYSALFLVFVNGIFDPRVALISIASGFLWGLMEIAHKRTVIFKTAVSLILFSVALIGLWGYWIFPLFAFGVDIGISSAGGSGFVSLLHGLSLHQPHWPGNEFGMVTPPSFYFLLFPIVIFAGAIFVRSKSYRKFLVLFLAFVFLAKGANYPLGGLYAWLLKNAPFFVAFRDSTKFYIPLVLFAGIMFGLVSTIRKDLRVFWFLLIIIFAGVWQGFFGGLTGVLSRQYKNEDFDMLAEKIKEDNSFYRSVWFPETHYYTYETNSHPAVSAKALADLRPFARLTTGTYDRFNFLHNREYVWWMRLLGMRYLIFSGDPRDKNVDLDESATWEDLEERVATDSALVKAETDTSFPVYELNEWYPHIYGIERLFVVVGADDIYEQLIEQIGGRGFVFVEDGKVDVEQLINVSNESVSIVFNQSNTTDFAMSTLSDYFVSGESAHRADWAVRKTDEYLKYKYELLTKNFIYEGFDYGKGIAFSSVKGEEIALPLSASHSGDYVFAVRTQGGEGGQVSYTLSQDGGIVDEGMVPLSARYSWYTKSLSLEKGKYELIVKNEGGVVLFNVAGLVRRSSYDAAVGFVNTLQNRFGVTEADDLKEQAAVYGDVDYQFVSPAEYQISLSNDYRWIVFTDLYNDGWKLKKGGDSLPLPFFSTVNGFYTESGGEARLVFEGQKHVWVGIVVTMVSLIISVVSYLASKTIEWKK